MVECNGECAIQDESKIFGHTQAFAETDSVDDSYDINVMKLGWGQKETKYFILADNGDDELYDNLWVAEISSEYQGLTVRIEESVSKGVKNKERRNVVMEYKLDCDRTKEDKKEKHKEIVQNNQRVEVFNNEVIEHGSSSGSDAIMTKVGDIWKDRNRCMNVIEIIDKRYIITYSISEVEKLSEPVIQFWKIVTIESIEYNYSMHALNTTIYEKSKIHEIVSDSMIAEIEQNYQCNESRILKSLDYINDKKNKHNYISLASRDERIFKKQEDNEKGPHPLNGENCQEIEATYKTMKKEQMCNVHSFIIDAEDKTVKKHFDERELEEISDASGHCGDGCKGDWIIRTNSKGKKNEFGYGEVGKTWIDKSGTKFLREVSLKSLKILKNMLIDLMRTCKWNPDALSKLQTVGVVHLGYVCRVNRSNIMEVTHNEENFSDTLEILAAVLNLK
ncbi:27202_t:CDS:10, partial [Gigaspora margarita]